MRKTFRDMMKSVALHCVAAGAVLTVLSMASCKQGHVPNAQLPELRNDTGVNIMLTLDPNGGFWDNPKEIESKKLLGKKAGDPLPVAPIPQHETKVFNGWNTVGGTLPERFPSASATYKALWRDLTADERFYTVEHLLENADDAGFTRTAMEKRAGTVGSKPSANSHNYEGFTYTADISSVPAAIAEDGSTKVALKYKRNEVTLTFDLDGGRTETPLTGGNSLTGKWGAKFSIKAPTKSSMAFNGWNTVGGKLPERFPKTSAAYKALWRDANAPAPATDNLVQNADFSETEPASGTFSSYWGGNPSPKHWVTYAKAPATADVQFKVENKTFTVTTGAAKQGQAGLYQVMTLPDVTPGTTYSLSMMIHVATKKPEGAGGALIRVGHIPLWTKYSGNKSYTAQLTVTADGKLSFENDKKPPETVTADLSGKNKNQIKLECFAYGLKAGTVSFSNISLTKESTGQPETPPSDPSTESNTTFYTIEHWQENADDDQFTKKDTETKTGKIGDTPEAPQKDYEGFTYDAAASASTIPSKIEASGTTVQLKYKRNRVTLTFELDGGSSTSLPSGKTLTGKYGSTLTVERPTKLGHIFTGWNSTGGTLPATFPLANETYTAQWEPDATPPMPENLVKNADFSKLTEDKSNFKKYWADGKRPASWNTWASAANTADVTFTATGGKFTIQAGNTVFQQGGIQQPILLENGTQYTLSVTVKLTNLTGGNQKGGCEVKLCNQIKKLFGGQDTITLEVIGSTSAKLELLVTGLQNKKVEFSAITLTKK
nr:carbohydrate binding domain-containing protein [uncultured Treponema sp.]